MNLTHPPRPRPDDNPPDARCSFCGRPRAHTGPMVEGPNEAYIPLGDAAAGHFTNHADARLR